MYCSRISLILCSFDRLFTGRFEKIQKTNELQNQVPEKYSSFKYWFKFFAAKFRLSIESYV